MSQHEASELGIGEVSRRAGLRPSAIRYYEALGLVMPLTRSGGRRVYSQDAVERLALIAFAKNAGFSLDDIRRLLDGFPEDTSAGARWNEMATAKLADLDAMTRRIDAMRDSLTRIRGCRCITLDQCAKAMAKSRCG
ncbi:MAG TPA: MerR family transcriptional regulator [Thermoanaerobaculia bacterium]|nr:MerR family transcriptional regulator [Thermoanaerobaculia bacterium]